MPKSKQPLWKITKTYCNHPNKYVYIQGSEDNVVNMMDNLGNDTEDGGAAMIDYKSIRKVPKDKHVIKV